MRRRFGNRTGSRRTIASGICRLRGLLLAAVSPAGLALGAPALAAVALAGAVTFAQPAYAEQIGSGLLLGEGQKTGDDTPMLVEADELIYDYDANTVTARGSVQIYYGSYTLEASEVTYNRTTSRVLAEGNVRVTEPDGNILHAESADLTDTFGEGFVKSLQVETADETRFAAETAERVDGEKTTFNKGVYTACKPCEENPDKPPLWQVKATRIIHDQKKKMVYYKQARLEFFGVPIAYVPMFWHPDPTVKRKSGFLTPRLGYSEHRGFGFGVPYYWEVAPNADITFTPMTYSKQGYLGAAEWRHRLINGSYSIRAAGIYQQEPLEYKGLPGETEWRGAINTTGKFDINGWWTTGWDISGTTDRTFLSDYEPWAARSDVIVSNIYLNGQSLTNYFDARLYYFRVATNGTRLVPTAQNLGKTVVDRQAKQAVVYPVVDYSYVFSPSTIGGEAGIEFNLVNLSRDVGDTQQVNGADFYRGLEGNFARASLDAHWRRTFIDGMGQMFTPFASVRSDVFWLDTNSTQILPSNYDVTRDVVFRGMPAVGMEYRWPFIASHSWGSQVFEPIAQIVARPNEAYAGDLPNEDAQSLVFDDTNLFDTDKFSGFDRVEGGGRLNYGFNYTANFNRGASISAMIGQSFHLFGENPYAANDLARAGKDSGLETRLSDYVARLNIQATRSLSIGTRARFDEHDFDLKRFEATARVDHKPVITTASYAYFDKQPDLGITKERHEVYNSLAYRFAENWQALATARYDIVNKSLVAGSIGMAYDDECFKASLVYTETRNRYTNVTADKSVMLRVQLRTIGDGQISTKTENLF